MVPPCAVSLNSVGEGFGDRLTLNVFFSPVSVYSLASFAKHAIETGNVLYDPLPQALFPLTEMLPPVVANLTVTAVLEVARVLVVEVVTPSDNLEPVGLSQ